jgi:hypothetical protein
MDKLSAQAIAVDILKQEGWVYHKLVSCESLAPKWIAFMVSVCDSLPRCPRELWEVRFELTAPSDSQWESHGVLSVLVDGETGKTGIYR